MDLNNSFDFIRHLNVAHHVKGRIRFRIAPTALSSISQINHQELTGFIRSLSGIEDVRINPIAASVVVYYNPQEIQPSWWEQLMHSHQSEIPQIFANLKRRNDYVSSY